MLRATRTSSSLWRAEIKDDSVSYFWRSCFGHRANPLSLPKFMSKRKISAVFSSRNARHSSEVDATHGQAHAEHLEIFLRHAGKISFIIDYQTVIIHIPKYNTSDPVWNPFTYSR